MKGFWLDQKTITPAPEADLGGQNTDEREQCEGFLQEVPKISIEIPIEKSLYEKTIHTIHGETKTNDMKPLQESSQDPVNSSQKLFTSEDDRQLYFQLQQLLLSDVWSNTEKLFFSHTGKMVKKDAYLVTLREWLVSDDRAQHDAALVEIRKRLGQEAQA